MTTAAKSSPSSRSTGGIYDRSTVIDVAEAQEIASYFAVRTDREIANQFAAFASSGVATPLLEAAVDWTIRLIQNGRLSSVFVEHNARQSMIRLRALQQFCAHR